MAKAKTPNVPIRSWSSNPLVNYFFRLPRNCFHSCNVLATLSVVMFFFRLFSFFVLANLSIFFLTLLIPLFLQPCPLLLFFPDSSHSMVVSFLSTVLAPYYFGGARSKGFATFRNVPKLTFFLPDWVRKAGL